jgi:hypothetical protein
MDDFRDNINIACAAVKSNPRALRYAHRSLNDNDQFIQCMIDNKIPPVRKPGLKTHMMERLQFNRIAERSLPDPISKEVTNYLGGRTRKYKRIRKRTRKI